MEQTEKERNETFWCPGNYKWTTERIKLMFLFCEDMERLIRLRAEDEVMYAHNLKKWTEKCRKCIELGSGCETVERAWNSILCETDRVADIHENVSKNLLQNCLRRFKLWRKTFYGPPNRAASNYSHEIFRRYLNIKGRKNMKKAFEEVQKPYEKLLNQMEKMRDKYYEACLDFKVLFDRIERELERTTEVTETQVFYSFRLKRMNKLREAEYRLKRRREKYVNALKDLANYCPIYKDNMTAIYREWERHEIHKRQMLKIPLVSMCFTLKMLQYSSNPTLSMVFENVQEAIENINQRDSKWLSNNYQGIELPISVPSDIDDENRSDTSSTSNENFLRLMEYSIIEDVGSEASSMTIDDTWKQAKNDSNTNAIKNEEINTANEQFSISYNSLTEHLPVHHEPDSDSDAYEDAIDFKYEDFIEPK